MPTFMKCHSHRSQPGIQNSSDPKSLDSHVWTNSVDPDQPEQSDQGLQFSIPSSS